MFEQTKIISDELERLVVVLDLRVQACQIKSIQNVILFDFAEVFVAL